VDTGEVSRLAFRRVRGDTPHQSHCSVLFVAQADRPSQVAIRRAIELADGAPIAVLGLLKIHGYAMGMPNPGLMPTPKEREASLKLVSTVVSAIGRAGAEVDGQVTATRNPTKAITKVARTRGVGHVVIDRRPSSRLRRSLEGDVAPALRRRLRTAEIVVIESGLPPK
jgi:K+-sensing histidine kinase KdpD